MGEQIWWSRDERQRLMKNDKKLMRIFWTNSTDNNIIKMNIEYEH